MKNLAKGSFYAAVILGIAPFIMIGALISFLVLCVTIGGFSVVAGIFPSSTLLLKRATSLVVRGAVDAVLATLFGRFSFA